MNNIRLRKLQKVNMLQIYWDRQEASGIKTKIRAERKNGGPKTEVILLQSAPIPTHREVKM